MIKLGQELKVKIEDHNEKGIAIARYEGKKLFIKSVIKDEEALVKIIDVRDKYFKAKLLKVIDSSSSRADPPCQYYDECGGCNLQHFTDEAYLNLKHRFAKNIIDNLGVNQDVLQKVEYVGAKARRKVSLKISYDEILKVGFFQENTNQVVDISSCYIASDRINKIIVKLKDLLLSLNNCRIIKEILLTDLSDKIDIVAKTSEYFTKTDKQIIKDFAELNNIARFTQITDQEIVIFDNNSAAIDFGKFLINYPSDSFIQASKIAETTIVKIIKSYSKTQQNILDLFAGLGTYSFNFCLDAYSISAYEGNKVMVNAALQAIIKYNLEDKIRFFTRDLFKKPLISKELKKFDLVIINPPRDGAKNQIIELSKTNIPIIIIVSCNPTSFNRDAKILISGNYSLIELTPIDQFYYSSHLELVGVFKKFSS
ncbi:MAG: class I SAM-dependent RNA methyltransferase [Rickettsiales bacterium]|nr:class I SAM-dependent RNA methyltransferase [Rickettsiales bacterium]